MDEIDYPYQQHSGEKSKSKLIPIHKYFKVNLKRFLLETTLNGLKYVYDRERNIWERGYYLISFTVVFTSGIYMAYYFFEKWQNTPVIISMSSETTSIQDIPFPTVTFCNMNQALRSKVENFPKDSPDYALLQKLCFQEYNYTGFRNFTPRYKGDTFTNFIIRNAQTCESMIIYCKYGPNEYKCTDLFREVLLDEGMCCVFNQMHPFFLYNGESKLIRDYTSTNGRTTIPINWSIENGYKKPLPKDFYPRTAIGSGVTMGLTVVLNADVEDYYCSSTNGAGFKMLLFNPIDSPHIKDTGLPITLGHQTRVRINPKRMESAQNLRNVKAQDRQCYFSNEKELKYFKYYTRRNCEMECDAQFVYSVCRCIPYYMAMIERNASVCFLKDMECVEFAERYLVDVKAQSCKVHCLAGCQELMFYPDLFVSPLSRRNYSLLDTFYSNITTEVMERDLAQVQIYYQENFFRGNTKVPYTGLTEFLSQTGGVMSLMVGFSVISIAEFFYFGFMKILFDMILHRLPQKVDIKDDFEEEDMVDENEETPMDKLHHQMLSKHRKTVQNKVMVWNKDDFEKY
ncbi:pickpocket protein 28-like isoform X2 [Musca autumnalis]|uniref:pickpocket protein 28-like isoform X2 n=1 Tax=Musca autumnalis TaxID=221902 RepID=UPI003CECA1E9